MEKNDRMDTYLEIWVVYAKKLFVENDLPQFIKRLKLSIDSFFDEKCADLSLQEKITLSRRIESVINDPDLLYEVLDLTPPVDSELKPGNSPIPNYRLIKRLGSGGYGEVWEAAAPGNVMVALKFLPKGSFLGKFSSNTEIEALRKVMNIRHVNLVPISAVWEKTNPQYIVYQMALSSATLSSALKFSEKSQGLPAEILLPYFQDTAAALDCLNHPGAANLHDAATSENRVPILHGDVKPDNIFVQENRALLGDFGSVRIIDGKPNDEIGSYSPAFVAPERMQKKVSVHSDQYSLAATWFFMRTGHPLFPDMGAKTRVADDSTQDQKTAVTPCPNLSQLPRRERKILARALNTNPDERYATNMDFVKALAHRRSLFPWIALSLILCMILATYFYSMKERQRIAQEQIAEQQRIAQEQKAERQRLVQEQKAERLQKAHDEYVTAASSVAMQMAGQMLVYQQLGGMADDVYSEWVEMVQKYKSTPSMRNEYIEDFCHAIDSKLESQKIAYPDHIIPPNDVTLKVLQENGAQMEEIKAFYDLVDPGIHVSYADHLNLMKKNAQEFHLGGKCNDMKVMAYWEKYAGICDRGLKKQLDVAYLAYLELLTSMPTETQEKAHTFLVEQKITLANKVALNLTAAQYLQMQNDIYAEMQKEMDDFGADINDVKKETEEETIRVKELLEREKRIEEKEKKIEGLKNEFNERIQNMDELAQKIIEKTTFLPEDTPQVMWGKNMRLASLFRLRMNSGILPYKDIFNLLQQRWDELAPKCGDDEEMRYCVQAIKRFFTLVEEKKIPDNGIIVYTIENHAKHPFLQAGDILLETNGHAIKKVDDLDTYANPDKGNVIKWLRFNEAGEPVIETYTSSPGAPRVGYVEMREK